MKLTNLLRSLLLENEKAWHGSSNYFRRFKTEGIGGGIGAQVYGWGLYFGKNPNIAKNYTSVGPNAGKKKTLFQGKTAEELGLEYENEIFFGLPLGLETSQDYINYALETMALIEDEPNFEGKEETLNSYQRFIDIIENLEVNEELMSYLYQVILFPNKNPDYLNWDTLIPKEQLQKINTQAKKENINISITTSMIGGKVYFYLDRTFDSPKKASLFLLRAGIDGITHSGGSVRIIFDDKEVEIDKVYKSNEIDNLQESKKIIFEGFSEGTIKDMATKFQAEMNDTLSFDDIKQKLNRFDDIKSNLPKKIEAGLKNQEGGIVVPEKFTKADSKTGKILDPLNIKNYSWKDLEAVLDAYGVKGEKISKDFYTTQEANLVDIKGAPVIYSGNGIKVYEGSNYESCIRLNYAFKYKGGDNKIYTYNFCIGRKEPASNQYYTYRFGRGGGFRSFYFVVDTEQTADIKGSASDRNNFLNWYHIFVIHAFDNDKFGVTDAVNQFGGNHELTGNDKGVSWEEVGAFMIKNGGESGKKAWEKIKNYKELFKYISPSGEETDQALIRDRILNFEQFRELNRNQKRIYISKRAEQPNAFNSQMFRILDVELKNLAIRTGNGFKASYNDLKDNPSLSRSYAKFKFTRAVDFYKKTNQIVNPIPVSFIKYLTDEEKEQYIKIFDNNLTFDYIEKYFGEIQAKKYANEQASKLEYLPKKAINYIDDSNLKSLYSFYTKLFNNWAVDENTNTGDIDIDEKGEMPEQVIIPSPLTYNDWKSFTTKERELTLKLAEMSDKKIKKYLTLSYAVPYFLSNKNKFYAFLPKNNDMQDWIISDMNGNALITAQTGDILFNGYYMYSAYPNYETDNPQRIVPISNIKIKDKPNIQSILSEIAHIIKLSKLII
jgi:hypothetical protein